MHAALIKRRPPPLPPGATAVYDFQQGAVPGVVSDLSGHGYHAPVEGAVSWRSDGLQLTGGRVNLHALPARAERTNIVVYTLPPDPASDWQMVLRESDASYLAVRVDYAPIIAVDMDYQYNLNDPQHPFLPGGTYFHAGSIGSSTIVHYALSEAAISLTGTPPARPAVSFGPFDFGVFGGVLHYALLYPRALSRAEVMQARAHLRATLARRGVRI